MCRPLRSAAAAAATLRTASSRECPRETGTNLPIRIAVPSNGIRIRLLFSMTLVMPGTEGSNTGGSRLETWLLMNMLGSAGTFSSPTTRTRMPAARTPSRITPIPQPYIVLKSPRSADHGIPTKAAGPPRTRNTANIRSEAHILAHQKGGRLTACLALLVRKLFPAGLEAGSLDCLGQLVIDTAEAAVGED